MRSTSERCDRNRDMCRARRARSRLLWAFCRRCWLSGMGSRHVLSAWGERVLAYNATCRGPVAVPSPRGAGQCAALRRAAAATLGSRVLLASGSLGRARPVPPLYCWMFRVLLPLSLVLLGATL